MAETSVSPSHGFHFALRITVQPNTQRPSPQCTLHLLQVFPADVFVDPYELAQQQNDGVLPPFRVWGKTEIEAAVTHVDPVPSMVLFSITAQTTLDLPFHARYPAPSSQQYSTVSLAHPLVFYSCPLANPRSKASNPLAHIPHPFISPFNLTTTSIHTLSRSSMQSLSFSVPTGQLEHSAFVEWITIFTLIIVCLYIGQAMWDAASRLGDSDMEDKDK